MSCSRHASLVVLLLIIVGSVVTCHNFDRVLAQPEDIVEMSPGTFSHTLGTPANIVKLDYPKSSILQNATGDISLNITLTADSSSISIYIPPEFSFVEPGVSNIWTSITNDYKHVSIRRLGSRDVIGPSWWIVTISNATIPSGDYFVRMFDLKAPVVCGRYFLKIFVDGQSIGSENFPTIVVKGGLDPAYISGRVLNGEHGEYGLPVNVSGRVIAEGTTPSGRAVQAQAYFDAMANGSYTIYGLAAGTYVLNASASGFAPTALNETVTVYPGQSLSGINIYLRQSATISSTISSKCVSELVPWGFAFNLSIGQIPRPISVQVSDSSGAQKALVIDVTDASLNFYQFSFNGSIELDGHVPQDEAAYVSGLGPGDYYLNAFVNEYVQRDVIVVHVNDYSRGISVPFDLWRSGWFQVTVFFRDSEGGQPAPVPRTGQLTLKAYRLDGTLAGSNTTIVPEGTQTFAMEITGILNASSTRLISSQRDSGFPSGTYMIEGSFPGYLSASLPQATIGGGCSMTEIGLEMILAGALEITVRSVSWQTPSQEVPWEFPGAAVRLELTDSTGEVYVGRAQQQSDASITVGNVTDLPADTYLVRVYTPGYVLTRDYTTQVSLGDITGITVDLLETPPMQITLVFITAGLIAPVDAYPYSLTQVPARIEVYDKFGILAGANATYVPFGESNSTVEVVGFQNYAGNPSLKWANYYDTTDGSLQKDYGLIAGTYLVRVWVPGYLQMETTTVATSSSSAIGTTLSLDRLAHVFGSVLGLNMYGDVIPLSWANVTAYGPILTATSSLDGFYEIWLVSGTYTLAASHAAYETRASEIYVSTGWETPTDFYLQLPGGTVPELSTAGFALFAVLILACVLLSEFNSHRGWRRFSHFGSSKPKSDSDLSAVELQ